MARNDQWLKDRFNNLYKRFFSDIKIINTIIIKFGRGNKTRLGSIRPGRFGQNKQKYSFITINGHFKDIAIPEFVIDAVICHEFMHYAHGFASPHEKKFSFPHKGGVVNRDLIHRGLREILILEKKWIRSNWQNYIKNNKVN